MRDGERTGRTMGGRLNCVVAVVARSLGGAPSPRCLVDCGRRGRTVIGFDESQEGITGAGRGAGRREESSGLLSSRACYKPSSCYSLSGRWLLSFRGAPDVNARRRCSNESSTSCGVPSPSEGFTRPYNPAAINTYIWTG